MPAPDTTDISKMPMPGGNVNAPASGTYGEQAALDRLQAQLPSAPVGSAPSAADPSAPMPVPGIANPPAPPAGGVPPAIMAPTRRPDVPVSTPLNVGAPAAAGSVSDRQRRLAILDALTSTPGVSDETREWAALVRDRLISRSAS